MQCSSCVNWGDKLDTETRCRICLLSKQPKMADTIACSAFERALRTYTIEEAIACGLIRQPHAPVKLKL